MSQKLKPSSHIPPTEINPTEIKAPRKKGIPWKPILLILLVISLMGAAYYFQLGKELAKVGTWIKSLGYWGPLAFVAIYIGATLLAIPGTALSIIGGAIFGAYLGTLLVSLGSTIGAGLAFLISRHMARDSVEEWLKENRQFQKLDQLTSKQGAFMVALTRLVPLFPFNLLNYGFGLTKVSFGTYLFWSWLCMLPGTFLYVGGSDLLSQAIQKGEVPYGLLIGLFVLFIILLIIGKKGKAFFQEKEENSK